MLWATPQARDTHNPSEPDSERTKRKLAEGWTIDLNEQAAWHNTEAQAEQLFTPRFLTGLMGRDIRSIDDLTEDEAKRINEAEQLWQTAATDSFRSRGGDRKDEMGLDQQARLQWATPNSRDYKSESSGEAIQNHMEDHSPSLSKQVIYSHQDQATEQDGPNSSEKPRGSRRRLNPAFVCQLMAWPWWWTNPEPISFARAAMESFLSRARRHLSSLGGGRDDEN